MDLLATLGLDALGVDTGLFGQLGLDALGVLLRLTGDAAGLGLGVGQCLGVHGIGVGEPLRRLGALGQGDADGFLLLDHQPLHQGRHPFGDDEHDDGEADQLSDECRHLVVPSRIHVDAEDAARQGGRQAIHRRCQLGLSS